MRICLPVSPQYTTVTDTAEQTDGQTPHGGIGRAAKTTDLARLDR